MKQRVENTKSLRLYALFHCLALAATWGWFTALGSFAMLSFGLDQFQWWLLIAAACAGFYGLRPNLERAIDTAWLQGITETKALGERFAQLKPVKQRVTMIFSVVALVFFIGLLILYAYLGATA